MFLALKTGLIMSGSSSSDTAQYIDLFFKCSGFFLCYHINAVMVLAISEKHGRKTGT